MSRHKDELLRGSAAAAAAAVAATAAAAAAAAAAEDSITIIGVVILEFTWIPLLELTRRKLGRLRIISLSHIFVAKQKRERGEKVDVMSVSQSAVFLRCQSREQNHPRPFVPALKMRCLSPFL
jgi:hypothetical protein